jgi:hypothetical protein
MGTPRLPVVDWTDAPADLNGLVRFAERRNPVSARVPSHFKRTLECDTRRASDGWTLCEKKTEIFLLAMINNINVHNYSLQYRICNVTGTIHHAVPGTYGSVTKKWVNTSNWAFISIKAAWGGFRGSEGWGMEGQTTFCVQSIVWFQECSAYIYSKSPPPSRISWKLFSIIVSFMWQRAFWEKWRMSGQSSPCRSRIQKVRLAITLRYFGSRHRAVWFAGIDVSSQTRCLWPWPPVWRR